MALTPGQIGHFKSIKHAACADGAHDFGKYGFNTNRSENSGKPGLSEVLKGLHVTENAEINAIPTGRSRGEDVNSLRHESTMLQELFKDIGLGLPILSLSEDQTLIMKDITDALSKKPDSKDFFRHDFDIDTINGKTSYNVKLLSKLDKGRPERNLKKIGSLLTTDDYINFFGTDDLHVIIDAQTIGWNKLLRQAKNGVKMLQVTSLINREIVNDPATKTYDINEIRGDRDFGLPGNTLKLNIKYDACKADITYGHTVDAKLTESDLQRDKLFSVMDFRISPLKMKENALPGIALDIISPTSGRVYQSDNPHITNNIKQCWAGILDLFKIKTAKHIHTAAYFQCKRSGDWLQALACLDSKRPYMDETGRLEAIPSIKLITHDKILLWYALFLGIDVLFTYKILPKKLAGQPVKVEDDDDEHDEPIDEPIDKPEVPGSEKILLLFTNNTKSETPEQRRDRILAKAASFVVNITSSIYRGYLTKYNGWIQTIRTERNTKIKEIFDRWLQDSKNTSLIQDLLRAYWEFTAIDYKDMTGYFNDVDAAYKKYNTAKSVENAEAFIGACINFDSKMLSITQIEDIQTESDAYKNDSNYTGMVILMTVIGRPSRHDKGILSHESKAFITCEYLSSRLDTEMLQDLKGKFKIISDKLKASEPQTKYVLFNFVSKLNEIGNDDEGILTEIAIKENASIQGLIKVNVTSEEIEEIEETIEEEAPKPTGNKRKNVKTILALGKSVKEFAGRIFGKASKKKGGGNAEDTTSYMLCLCYLHELMNTLNGFDSQDSDYLYYDALTRLVVSSFSLINNDYDSLQAILYDVLPSGEWNDEYKMLKPIFSSNVTTAAYHVAHHSLNMREGDIYSLGHEGHITPTIIANYRKLTNDVKDLPFIERQDLLFKRTVDCINRHFPGKLQQGIQGIQGVTVQPHVSVRNFMSPRKSILVKGGTRRSKFNKKRRNGSPRRKTRGRTHKSRAHP